jgi:hypothetical protein
VYLKKEGFLEDLGSRKWKIVGPEARFAGWVQIRLIIVLHNVENQPHTPSPHFSNLPKWTPGLLHHGSILTAPPQYH